jgi:hypothetical protein
MSETLQPAHSKNITSFRTLFPSPQPDFVIYAGKEADYSHVHFCSWQDMSVLP